MVRIGTTVMIVLILLRIARQAPAQAQSSDPVRRLFLLGLGAPGVGTWSSPEIAEPPSPAGIRAQDRAPRHRRAPPARMPVAPAPSADGARTQNRGGGLGRPHWLELNTWMKVERLLVEKLHQSFSLDH
uniref:Uncharacterized protein n=1 Tax=Saimiri boliviensis boliviensis TaxID=39432 RepID=A0A2K6UCZ9_SAIBB